MGEAKAEGAGVANAEGGEPGKVGVTVPVKAGGGESEDAEVDSLHPGQELALLRFVPRIIRVGRPLAYSNEVAESFKRSHPLFDRFFYPALYGIAFGYIGLDIAYGVYSHRADGTNAMALKLFDSTLFHGLASVYLPGVIIHQAVHHTTTFVKRRGYTNFMTRSPILVGLGLIPLIVPPIDHGVEFRLSRFVRCHYPPDILKKFQFEH